MPQISLRCKRWAQGRIRNWGRQQLREAWHLIQNRRLNLCGSHRILSNVGGRIESLVEQGVRELPTSFQSVGQIASRLGIFQMMNARLRSRLTQSKSLIRPEDPQGQSSQMKDVTLPPEFWDELEKYFTTLGLDVPNYFDHKKGWDASLNVDGLPDQTGSGVKKAQNVKFFTAVLGALNQQNMQDDLLLSNLGAQENQLMQTQNFQINLLSQLAGNESQVQSRIYQAHL